MDGSVNVSLIYRFLLSTAVQNEYNVSVTCTSEMKLRLDNDAAFNYTSYATYL